MNLAELLTIQAQERPEAPALIDFYRGRRRSMSFGELERAATRAAAGLSEYGLRAGDGVLVLQPMSIELYIALAAILRAGLVAMFLDPHAGRDHIEQCCALWSPRALIASPKAHLLRCTSRALRRIPFQVSVGLRLPWAISFTRLQCSESNEAARSCPADTLALITFTSGSTGRAKAAVRTHGFLANQLQVLHRALQFVPGERDLTTLPTFALANLAAGLTTVIPAADLCRPNTAGLARVVRQVRAEEVDRLSAAPAFLELLAKYWRANSDAPMEVRKIFTGGGPVFPDLLDRLSDLAPGAQVSAVYGCTEAEPIATMERGEMRSADRTAMLRGAGLLAGRINEGITARILPDSFGKILGPISPRQFDALCLPPGGRGEIVVSGRHVLKEYLSADDNAETKIPIDDMIWHRTGDAGYIDGEGRLWLLGRCCARIGDAPKSFFPLELEAALRQLAPDCRATLALINGHRILVAERGGSEGLAQARAVMDRFEVTRIELVESLPLDKRHQSKIDYRALEKMLG